MAHNFTITIRGSAESADAVSKVADDAIAALKSGGATIDAGVTSTQRTLVESAPELRDERRAAALARIKGRSPASPSAPAAVKEPQP